MPGKGTPENLRNFDAMSLRLEPLAMVNAAPFLINGGLGNLRKPSNRLDDVSS